MSGVIPMTTGRLLEVINLPQAMKVNKIWETEQVAAINYLSRYLLPDYLSFLETGDGDFPVAAGKLGEMAVGKCTYGLALPLLNLHTAGKGIVKKTGIEDNATELLTVGETTEYSKVLKREALESVSEYLNERGKTALKDFKSGSRYRCSLIGGR